MPDMELQDALRGSVEEVLEKMFFVQPLEAESDAADSPCILAVKLAFEGEPSGALTLAISEPAARQIAADFMGQEESELAPGKTAEVVCELANMICGSVLSRVESQATFNLASPKLLAADAWRFAPHAAEGRAIHTVQLLNGSLTAIVETREMSCPAEKPAF